MKLMTKELERKLPPLYANENVDDPVVIAKYFHPMSDWTWYATEYDPIERRFFGLVDGFEKELGYFSLDEMESVKVHGLGIERDLYWTPKPLSEVMN